MLTIRINRRVAFLVVLGVLLTIPAASWASHQFTDVPDSNTFHEDIGWLADAGVTFGCNPPTNDQFCPGDAVTRAQMSAFMRRFAVYLDAEDGTPGFADTAGDAATLDGQAPSDFARTSDLAAKANAADVYTKAEIDAKLSGSISISGAAFRARAPDTTSRIGSGGELIMSTGTDDRFFAPVVLPHGATITGMHATLWDNSGTEYLRLELQRVAYISGYSTLATIDSTTSIGADTPYSTASISNGTIDTETYTYVLSVYDPAGNWADFGTDLRFQGVRIDYTM